MTYMVLTESEAPKKWKAVFYDQNDRKLRTIRFGQQGMEDYTQHGDKQRQKSYLQRHTKDSHLPMSAGELSRTILWSSPSFQQGIRNYEIKHGIKIIHEIKKKLELKCDYFSQIDYQLLTLQGLVLALLWVVTKAWLLVLQWIYVQINLA